MRELPNPWIPDRPRFDEKFDADAFFSEIEPAPVFLRDPSPEFMTALDMEPIRKVLRMFT